ncbi:MAG TPA: M28 family metallopeptidase, partial [Candidatus Thermoplasmatota archaeon]
KERSGRRERHYSHHAHLVSKAINARNRGAKAVILVNGDIEDSGELVKFGSVAGPDDASILMVQVTNAVAEKWFAAAGKPLSELQKSIDGNGRPQSFVFPDSFKISLGVEIERKQATVHNVIGYLPGETDEYIIIGAHHDHLGPGFPGADDDASGVAAVREAARILYARRADLRRPVVIAFFGAEEWGLRGSAWCSRHLPPGVQRIVAALTLDTVGRRGVNAVSVVGKTIYPALGEVAARCLDAEGFDRGREIDRFAFAWGSDHYALHAAGIHAVDLFSSDYGVMHTPEDTPDHIDPEKLTRLARAAAAFALDLSRKGLPR